jgi:hypothetical protein
MIEPPAHPCLLQHCLQCQALEAAWTDEWINKMWYIHTVEFYSAIKKNEIILFAGKWMKL